MSTDEGFGDKRVLNESLVSKPGILLLDTHCKDNLNTNVVPISCSSTNRYNSDITSWINSSLSVTALTPPKPITLVQLRSEIDFS